MPNSKRFEEYNKVFNAMIEINNDPCKLRDFLLCSNGQPQMNLRDYAEEFLVGKENPARFADAMNDIRLLERADIACRSGLVIDEVGFFKTKKVRFISKEQNEKFKNSFEF